MSKVVIRRKNATKSFNKTQKGLAEKVAMVGKETMKVVYPEFRAGDTLKVHVRIKEGDKERVQPYEGLCIKISGAGSSKSFIVRKMSHGVGVERIFLFSSTKVTKVDVVSKGKVRRAKLYYIRELEGRAAKIEREVETQATIDARAVAKAGAKAEKAAANAKK